MRIFCPLLAVAVLSGCSLFSSSSHSPDADSVFTSTSDDFIGGYLAWRPQTGTSLGFHQYDGRVTDFRKASLDAELARLKSYDRQLAELAPAQLSPQSYYDYRILKNAITREIFAFEQMQIYTQNPMTYAGAIDVNIYIKRDFAPLPERVRSIIAILKQAPNIMAAARTNLAEALPRPFIETAIEQANGSADFLAKDLVDALKEGKVEGQLLTDFTAANKLAIDELRGYATYLKEQKLPKANDRYALGRNRYLQMLLCGEMITQSPERLLEIGMRELAHQQKVFTDTARLIDPTKPAYEVFRAIQKDHPTEPGLIPDTGKNLETIRQFVVDKRIVTLPSQVRAKITETPQYLRATSFASMDTPGPFETKATEAWYYVTPVESDWPAAQKEEWLTAFNYYTTDIVSIHEAYPGHYVQFLCMNASKASNIEKIFGSYAFVEGWAHYAEQMLVDEGYGAGSDPMRAAKYRLAQTDEALLRLCRFCVSIKMHTMGMTVDEGTKFFQDNCFYEPKPARSEAMRGTFDPEYLYYTVGKLEILKLRDDYKKQEGSSFTLQKFHDEMLRHGTPPIRLLREIMLKDKAQWSEVF